MVNFRRVLIERLFSEQLRDLLGIEKNREKDDLEAFKAVAKNLIVNILKTVEDTDALWELIVSLRN